MTGDFRFVRTNGADPDFAENCRLLDMDLERARSGSIRMTISKTLRS
jgi:hypothetical protein